MPMPAHKRQDRELTPRQLAFANELAANGGIVMAAAITAGYSRAYARNGSSKNSAYALAKDPRITVIVNRIRQAKQQRTDWDVNRWRTETVALLADVRDTHPATAAKLLELLGRHVGAFADGLPSAQAAQAFAFLTAAMAGAPLAQAAEGPAALPAASQSTEDAHDAHEDAGA